MVKITQWTTLEKINLLKKYSIFSAFLINSLLKRNNRILFKNQIFRKRFEGEIDVSFEKLRCDSEIN